MSEREVLELDVLFVGAGPASLAGAIHLQKLLKETGRVASVAVLEKAAEVGGHSLSGAIVDPRALLELLPDYESQNIPFESEVTEEHLYYLTAGKKFSFPFIPSAMSHHGCFVASLGKLNRWMGEYCENQGVDIFCGFSGTELLYNGDQVIGVRTGDRGINKDGEKNLNMNRGRTFTPKLLFWVKGPGGI
mgnify:CR=1 FL=1